MKSLALEGASMRKLLFVMSLVASLVACNNDKPEDKTPAPKKLIESRFGLFDIAENNNIQVVDPFGKPLAGAKVLIGKNVDELPSNFVATDSKGIVAINPAWPARADVTVKANGFIRLTLLNQNLSGMVIKLSAAPVAPLKLVGEVTQLPVENNDGIMDFGIVMPTLRKTDLLTFDIGKVVSEETDTIEVYGETINIPKNISLPNQRERYGLFPVSMGKPEFSLRFPQPGRYRAYAVRGRFPFRTVIDSMKNGGEFYYLLNITEFNGGVLRDFDLTKDLRMDLPANEMKFNQRISVEGPQIKADEDFIVLATTQKDGTLFPTDLKILESKQKLKMNTLPGGENYLVGVLKKKSEMKSNVPNAARLSAVLTKMGDSGSSVLMPLVEAPTVASLREINVTQPDLPEGLTPSGMIAVLSTVTEVNRDGKRAVSLAREWEVFGSEWQARIILPLMPGDDLQPAKRRWEVSLVGTDQQNVVSIGPEMLESATHVTRSSADFR